MARSSEKSRVEKELLDMSRDKTSGVTFSTVGDQMNLMLGSLEGPKDTPYEGGTFYVDIELGKNYPYEPPKMKFKTKVWHPNISSANGAICLDILKDQWSPALTLKTCLLSLQALLSTPQPDDPQDAVVAKEYISNYAKWKQTAKQWTEQYAMRTEATDSDKVARLQEMGFSKEKCLLALNASDGDENRALDMLLGGA